MSGNEPQRSCIACRATTSKRDLLRFVLSPESELVPDLLAKLPGRGAYTCMNSACVKRALQKRLFNRAFKREVSSPEAELFVGKVIARMEERIGSYIALANKAGRVVSGSDMVMDLVRKRKTGFLFIASDISPEIGAKILELAKRHDVSHESIFDKERLGVLVGKGLRSVVAVENGGFVETIRHEATRYRNFLEGGMEAR